jgi:putative IMPACT (imprinted ancient) family translation regulator
MLKNTDYSQKVVMDILIPAGQEDEFTDWVANLTNGQVEINRGKTGYVELVV